MNYQIKLVTRDGFEKTVPLSDVPIKAQRTGPYRVPEPMRKSAHWAAGEEPCDLCFSHYEREFFPDSERPWVWVEQ